MDTVDEIMTDAERIHFDTQGYLWIDRALDSARLAEVRDAASGALARWRSDTSLPGIRSATLQQVQAPIEHDERLLSLLWHPVVFPKVRALLGDDVSMIDNDYFVTPPRTPKTHAHWHHDVGMPGVDHANSLLMVKVFFLLSDVHGDCGPTVVIPGSHRLPTNYAYPLVDDPISMPGSVALTGSAGDAYLFNGRIYHAAANNDSDRERHVLIYNYGHFWMKTWSGYEPSERLLADARRSNDPVRKQLLGIGDAYGQRLPKDGPPTLGDADGSGAGGSGA
jgi:phytanoyl-CoA hydroxylase